jgi:hypothetical protein
MKQEIYLILLVPAGKVGVEGVGRVVENHNIKVSCSKETFCRSVARNGVVSSKRKFVRR